MRYILEKLKKFREFVNEKNTIDIELSKKEIDSIFTDVKKYLSQNNKVENHYHNNKHMMNVFDNCMTLFNEYEEEYDLKSTDKLCLGLAALFHDYGHSGGKLKDDENIEIALTKIKKYLDMIDKSNLCKEVSRIVKATEFPHKDIKLDILQKIIRDADTMGGISDGWMSVVKTLAKEYGKTLKEFIPIQLKFLEDAKFNTDYCNELLKNNKSDIIEKLKKML